VGVIARVGCKFAPSLVWLDIEENVCMSGPAEELRGRHVMHGVKGIFQLRYLISGQLL
jgi:hypothetical protein